MFVRDHHRLIEIVLGTLDADRLRDGECLFAGGTALALRFGEYRESVDIDFVVSNADAYRDLRAMCKKDGLAAITVDGQRAVTAGPLRIDQYGIRTAVLVGGVSVKFEIIREGRIELDPPGQDDELQGLATPTLTDAMAMKLLANSDRWLDSSVFHRDIIDIALVDPGASVLRRAVAKAGAAYGDAVVRDARAAVASLIERQDLLRGCRQALGMEMSNADLTQRLYRLARRLQSNDPRGHTRSLGGGCPCARAGAVRAPRSRSCAA